MSLTKEEAALKHVLEHQIEIFEFLKCQFEDKPITPAIQNLMDMETEEFRENVPEIIDSLKTSLTGFNFDCTHKAEPPVDPKLVHREW